MAICPYGSHSAHGRTRRECGKARDTPDGQSLEPGYRKTRKTGQSCDGDRTAMAETLKWDQKRGTLQRIQFQSAAGLK